MSAENPNDIFSGQPRKFDPTMTEMEYEMVKKEFNNLFAGTMLSYFMEVTMLESRIIGKFGLIGRINDHSFEGTIRLHKKNNVYYFDVYNNDISELKETGLLEEKDVWNNIFPNPALQVIITQLERNKFGNLCKFGNEMDQMRKNLNSFENWILACATVLIYNFATNVGGEEESIDNPSFFDPERNPNTKIREYLARVGSTHLNLS